jgi:hypothetical protein
VNALISEVLPNFYVNSLLGHLFSDGVRSTSIFDQVGNIFFLVAWIDVLKKLSGFCYLKFIVVLVVILRSEKEMNRRRDMLANLRSKVNQMASTLNMSNFANRDSLIGPEIKQADAMSRAVGLDNSGHVGLQRQIMRGKLLSLYW